jgi:uncharacterized membrane protein
MNSRGECEMLTVALAFVVVYVALNLFTALVCYKKGKPVFGTFGLISIVFPLIIGWLALAGAIRIAKPDSDWAREKYRGSAEGDWKMAMAAQRFPQRAPAPSP